MTSITFCFLNSCAYNSIIFFESGFEFLHKNLCILDHGLIFSFYWPSKNPSCLLSLVCSMFMGDMCLITEMSPALLIRLLGSVFLIFLSEENSDFFYSRLSRKDPLFIVLSLDLLMMLLEKFLLFLTADSEVRSLIMQL